MKPPAEAHGLLCHYFHDGRDFPAAQGSLSIESFDALLESYGSRLIGAKEWLARCAEGRLGDAVVCTFDDGLYEAYALALPVLEARGLTACWNVYTGPFVGVPNNLEIYRWVRNHGYGDVDGFYAAWKTKVGPSWADRDEASLVSVTRAYLTLDDRRFREWRETVGANGYERAMDEMITEAGLDALDRQWWMTPAQLRDLQRSGHVIGLHTHSHPVDMTTLSQEQTALEFATCRMVLAGVLGCDPKALTTVSHPRGLATDGGLAWLAANGFTLAWGATMDGMAPWMAPRWSTGNWRL